MKYLVLKYVILGMNVILITTGFTLWLITDNYVAPVATGVVTLYLIASIRKMGPKEKGSQLFLGRPIQDVQPGPYYSPPGVFGIEKFPGVQVQYELPADPELVHKGDSPLPVGKFEPIRLLFGPPDPSDITLTGNPYNISMVSEVTPVFSIIVNSPMKFISRIGSIEELKKIVSDRMIGIASVSFALITPAKAQQTLHKVNQEIFDDLSDAYQNDEFGFELVEAYMKPFVFSHKLNSAVVGVSVAEQTALATKLTAEGEKQKLILEGDGKAQALLLIRTAEAEGYKVVAEKLGLQDNKALILQLETVKSMVENANYSILPGDGVYNLMGALTNMFQNQTTR